MSRHVEYIATLYSNPFLLAPVFIEFYKSLNKKPNSTLLMYTVLPLVLYPVSQHFLYGARITSSITTMTSDKSRMYGFEQRIEELKNLSSDCLQYALDCEALSLEDELILTPGTATMKSVLPHLDRPARNLGILFKPYDVPTIYRMLGVKRI